MNAKWDALPKWMDLDDFRDEGYLQEVNRRFFHPLGLALAIHLDASGRVTGLAGIYDKRDDPEGFVYEDVDPYKAEYLDAIITERSTDRISHRGWFMQPAPSTDPQHPGAPDE